MSRWKSPTQRRAVAAGWVALSVAATSALVAIWGSSDVWSVPQQWAATAGVFVVLAIVFGLAGAE